MDPAEFEILSRLTEQELLTRIGEELDRASPGVKPQSPEEHRATGSVWWQRNRTRLASLVCNSEILRVYRSSESLQKRVELVAAIFDLLASSKGVVAPASVAVLMANEGLRSLCGDHST